ncbi:hypothetical protein A6U98_01440 [Rhizobium sp. WYCCWR10014]|nr:hypothetical protein A6U98_01440 [Rhizobium sp. WYCCWR10014]
MMSWQGQAAAIAALANRSRSEKSPDCKNAKGGVETAILGELQERRPLFEVMIATPSIRGLEDPRAPQWRSSEESEVCQSKCLSRNSSKAASLGKDRPVQRRWIALRDRFIDDTLRTIGANCQRHPTWEDDGIVPHRLYQRGKVAL